MDIIKCKAVSLTGEWVFGYPYKRGTDIFMVPLVGMSDVQIVPNTICYSIMENDMDGRELFIGDIINDFGGGLYVTDTEHPDYHPMQAFPPVKQTGDSTRLGTIIWEEGCPKIETAALDYAYMFGSPAAPVSSFRYVGNQYDHLINKITPND